MSLQDLQKQGFKTKCGQHNGIIYYYIFKCHHWNFLLLTRSTMLDPNPFGNKQILIKIKSYQKLPCYHHQLVVLCITRQTTLSLKNAATWGPQA